MGITGNETADGLAANPLHSHEPLYQIIVNAGKYQASQGKL